MRKFRNEHSIRYVSDDKVNNGYKKTIISMCAIDNWIYECNQDICTHLVRALILPILALSLLCFLLYPPIAFLLYSYEYNKVRVATLAEYAPPQLNQVPKHLV